ncbi:uncharacterized protein LOC120294702 isoform X2 [Eucalyptus grandis]|uniref:uncharacterized protein LOC120294702 isoform X2 n=1 Tax=Eucalyptus grandis TaxID=71139 RepID=UPI00192E80B6|nr:uncharacterized protein LOC120294702 isoform X2 [Eucalyptus grandis]
MTIPSWTPEKQYLFARMHRISLRFNSFARVASYTQNIGTRQPECLKSERPTFKKKSLDRLMNPECRIFQRSRSGEISIKQLGRSFSRLELFDGYIDKSEDDRGPALSRLRSQCLEHPASTSKLSLLGCEKIQGQAAGDLFCRLEQAIVDDKSSRRQEFEEAVRQWMEEDNALDTKMSRC